MQVYLTALGCRLNEAELQMWADEFRAQGLVITSLIEDASLLVINTCAVTGEAARKSRQLIRKLHRQNPVARLVVSGCYASLEKQQAQALLGVDLVVPNADKNKLPMLAKELLEVPSMPFAATEPDENALFVRNRERAFIKIQDGCRYRCTYCIVTVARGEETSRTLDDLLNEVKRLQDVGIKEIVLTGVHVGGYGTDLGTSLYELVLALLQQTSIERIRFASVEPWDLPEQFFELFKNKRLMPHMHLPIQSGSDQILKKMSRRCKAKTFLQLVDKARKVVPDFNITSDIIVGFPGETEEDFALSQQIVEAANFGHVHIFSYSNREGTKAASLANQINGEVKKERSQRLHEVAAQVKQRQLSNMLGKRQNILWEGKGQRTDCGHFRFYGYTENYHKVFVDLEQAIDIGNQIVQCKIKQIDQNNGLLQVVPVSPLDNSRQRILLTQNLS